jgi:hypothetical protein
LERRIDNRVAALRWRRRLFLLGPPLAFSVLVTLIFIVRRVDLGTTGASLVALAIFAVAVWCALCLFWAPAARCPRCDHPMGGKLLSAHNVLWVWLPDPRCPACRFRPFDG